MKTKERHFYDDPEGHKSELSEGEPQVKPSKKQHYPRGNMGKEETNTNDRYGYEQYPRG